jgi:hypothetical protein
VLRCGAAGQDVHASGNYVAGVVLNFAGAPPLPLRTKWTRRVPHPVLIGHAASLPGGLIFSVGKFEQGRPGGPRGAWRWDWWAAALRARGVGIPKQAADAE